MISLLLWISAVLFVPCCWGNRVDLPWNVSVHFGPMSPVLPASAYKTIDVPGSRIVSLQFPYPLAGEAPMELLLHMDSIVPVNASHPILPHGTPCFEPTLHRRVEEENEGSVVLSLDVASRMPKECWKISALSWTLPYPTASPSSELPQDPQDAWQFVLDAHRHHVRLRLAVTARAYQPRIDRVHTFHHGVHPQDDSSLVEALTIHGQYLGFGSKDVQSVHVDRVPCDRVEWSSSRKLTCFLTNVAAAGFHHSLPIGDRKVSVQVATRSGGAHLVEKLTILDEPRILSISPKTGLVTDLTVISIHGRNFGHRGDRLVDVGLIVDVSAEDQPPSIANYSETTIAHEGNTERLVAARLSCMWSVIHVSPTVITCRISGTHGDYRNGSTSIPMYKIERGYAYVQTKDGSIAYNRQTMYTFRPACFLLGSRNQCSSTGCYWCQYATKCVDAGKECIEDCASPWLHMTCAERKGIITLLVVLFASALCLLVFIRHRNKLLAEDINYKMLMASPNLRRVVREANTEEGSEADGDEQHQYMASSAPIHLPHGQHPHLNMYHTMHPYRGSPSSSYRRGGLSYFLQYSRQELERKHNQLKEQTDTLTSFY